MSTVRTDLLQNRLGTSHPTVTKADFVKAWGFLTQIPATPTLLSGLNVSSITDLGVGYTGFVLTAPFASAQYAAVSGGWAQGGWPGRETGSKPNAASSAYLYNVEGSGVAIDSDSCSIMTAGVLA